MKKFKLSLNPSHEAVILDKGEYVGAYFCSCCDTQLLDGFDWEEHKKICHVFWDDAPVFRRIS